ncbi:CHAT domain-containing protein [Singulisphaera sp. PoT]|uniref:CHAT domain-containing tetratricopeptide repeat protein n=1 Tax=Singulisphaera sp. PoT TaxID=3411797 RepID=UPI003BF5E2ED
MPEISEAVPPVYWLNVCRGVEAAEAFMSYSGDHVLEVLQEYPILILPEFPEAMEKLAENMDDPEDQRLVAISANELRSVHENIMANFPNKSRSGLLLSCGIELVEEWQQDPRINITRSLALFKEAERGLDGPAAAGCRMNRANGLQLLAQLGDDVVANLRLADTLFADGLEGLDGPVVAVCLMNRANGLQSLAQLGEEAVANLRRADALYAEASEGLEEHFVAVCQTNNANCLKSLAHLGEEAVANLCRADALYAEAFKRLYGAAAARCLMNRANGLRSLAELGIASVANLHYADGLFVEALKSLEGADAANCLMNRGNVLLSLARLGEDSVANLRRADALYAEASLGLEGVFAARCRINRANGLTMLAELGKDTVANFHLADALYAEASNGLKGADAAVCLMNRGNALNSLARLGEDAVANLLHADALFVEALKSLEGPAAAGCRMNHANCLQSLADQGEDTVANLYRANALYAAALDGLVGHTSANCQMNLANGLQALARMGEEAVANLRRADTIYAEALEDLEGPYAANCRMNRAKGLQLLAQLGDEAEQNLDTSSRLQGEASGYFEEIGSWIRACQAFGDLGDLEALRERWPASRAAYSRAVECSDRVRAGATAITDRRNWSNGQHHLFQKLVEACLRCGDMSSALAYLERGTARSLLDLLHTEDSVPAIDPNQATRYRVLRRRLEELEAVLTRDGTDANQPYFDPERRRELARQRNEVRSELAALEDQIRQDDPDFFALAQPPDSRQMSEFARKLGSTLVFLWVASSDEVGRAFLIPPDREMIVVELPQLNDSHVREWLMGSADAIVRVGWFNAYPSPGAPQARWDAFGDEINLLLAELGSAIMEPILTALLPEMNSLSLIVPGWLGVLPLHAATRKDGDEVRYLVEDGITVHYSPSAWVLRRCFERSRLEWAPLLGMATDPSNRLALGEWELDAIEKVLTKADSTTGLTRLLGSAATLAAVMAALKDHPTAYLSCHGSFGFSDPRASALLLHDGVLTLGDLLDRMRLEVARLVILSACETGLGAGEGDGYLGLPTGFIVAGAKSVVGSLWPTDERATALLMVRMIESLGKGHWITEALRDAQHWLARLTRAEVEEFWVTRNLGKKPANSLAISFDGLEGDCPFAHPVYWAAFAVFGSPEPLIPWKDAAVAQT